jgi:hypothetical protein
LEKKLVLIGNPEKPETLYLIFDAFFDTVAEFLSSFWMAIFIHFETG